MNKLQKALIESITAAITGIILTTMISAFVEDGLLPRYSVFIFGFINVIGNIATIRSLNRLGILYCSGWALGLYIMRDALAPVDYWVNIVAAGAIIIFRIYYSSRKYFSRY